ncbi:MAG TPA: rod-binding protein [Candidatus Acidoferrum sp.]|nr:rod-binding protein [Candidatus Acidoferrum sp.]
MSTVQPSSFLQSLLSAHPPSKSASAAKIDPLTDHKLQKAAAEFEGQLLSALWKSMKTSFGDADGDSDDPAGQTLQDYGIDAMSQAVGKAGGLGIGRLIVKQLEAKIARSQNETPSKI